MTDRPEDRPQERRKTGPLGNEETRRDSSPEEGATRPVPTDRTEETAARGPEVERAAPHEEDTGNKETRVIRAPGSQATQEPTYPRGYFEAADERADRLRDMYGGVDWLASFLGFVFAAVLGALFFLVAGLVLRPLGGADFLGGGDLGATAITGLGLIAILIFLTYFFGGYVAGRLARFDGGRNGIVCVLFTAFVVLLLIPIGGFLPGPVGESTRDFIQGNIMPAVGGLSRIGVAGILIAVGAVLVAIIGGFLGGRLGSRYHYEIDRTT